MKASTKVMIGAALAAGVAAVITLFALARRELAETTTPSAVRTFGRAEWTLADIKGYNDSLTESDLTSICAALNREPHAVSKPVLRISRLSPTEILISTGEVRGPLDGGGNRVRLRRE